MFAERAPLLAIENTRSSVSKSPNSSNENIKSVLFIIENSASNQVLSRAQVDAKENVLAITGAGQLNFQPALKKKKEHLPTINFSVLNTNTIWSRASGKRLDVSRLIKSFQEKKNFFWLI